MSAAIVLHTNHGILAHPVGVVTPANGDGLARSRAYLNTHNGMGEHVAPEGHDPRTVAPGAVGGPRTPGQLWERVAELEATGLNYTERMERVKFDRIVSAAGRLSRESESRHYMRGPDAKFAPAHRSGVIESGTRRPNNVRAGERIK